MRPVRLRSRANRELQDTVEWYAERSAEVAARFASEVRQTLAHIEQYPDTGGFVPGVTDNDIRQFPVHNFPYSVIFIRLRTHISVLAIAHNRRRPGYWRD